MPPGAGANGATPRATAHRARYRSVTTAETLAAPAGKDYFRASREPRYSVLLALPLLLLYELFAFTLSGSTWAGVRNGADVMLKSLFLWLGGERGVMVFGILLLAIGAVLVVQDLRRHPGGLKRHVFALMMAESAVYAVLFGVVIGKLTALVLGMPALLMQIGGGQLDVPTQLVTSLGAGLYEELLFRVLLTGGLLWLFVKGLRWRRTVAAGVAVALSALIFSAFHYVGSLGDVFTVQSFTFRAIAGLAFSLLYVTRGLGVTAWTHALYDVFITLASVGSSQG